nr:MAG TPA: hypothetical protein [Caudoviricetes sp.]
MIVKRLELKNLLSLLLKEYLLHLFFLLYLC